jgi:hypothetical protein
MALAHDDDWAAGWQPRERADFVIHVAGGTRQAAILLDVAPSQPSRWSSGKSLPGPIHAVRLIDLDHVMAHALLVWDESVVRDWLTTPNGHLDGLTPAEWIRQHGTREVIDALQAEASGAYA